MVRPPAKPMTLSIYLVAEPLPLSVLAVDEPFFCLSFWLRRGLIDGIANSRSWVAVLQLRIGNRGTEGTNGRLACLSGWLTS